MFEQCFCCTIVGVSVEKEGVLSSCAASFVDTGFVQVSRNAVWCLQKCSPWAFSYHFCSIFHGNYIISNECNTYRLFDHFLGILFFADILLGVLLLSKETLQKLWAVELVLIGTCLLVLGISIWTPILVIISLAVGCTFVLRNSGSVSTIEAWRILVRNNKAFNRTSKRVIVLFIIGIGFLFTPVFIPSTYWFCHSVWHVCSFTGARFFVIWQTEAQFYIYFFGTK
jgi:hypothetical protein